jgi:hypothetical protein
MEITDDDKLQLKKLIASEGWKFLEKLIKSKIDYFDDQINVSAHDYLKVREKKYDDLNLNGAMIR